MGQVELSYEELEKEFIEALADLGREDLHSERAILATSYKDKVTARRMRLLSDGLTLYGWTASNSRKADQIKNNPNVSAVVEYIQIDGVASIKGHPINEPEFLDIIRRKLPHRYDSMVKNWTTLKDRVVVLVKPKRIALAKYDDPASGVIGGVYILDIEGKKAYRLDASDYTEATVYR
jgi:hypothetical protein